MTLTSQPARPDDRTLVLILADVLQEQGLWYELPAHVTDWLDMAVAEHENAKQAVTTWVADLDSVERQNE